MPGAGLIRVGADGVAERALTRGVRHPRFAVNSAGEAAKLTRKPRRPLLHPTRGHVGQNAPQRVLDRLSVPDDPEATIGRFARATRRQNVEFHGIVHPLSGRLTSLARGNELSTIGGIHSAMTPTRRRLIALAERNSAHRPDVAQRAVNALQRKGNLAGPRPIVVHNHPTFAGTNQTRHMPSAADTGSLLGENTRQQNRVVSLVPHAPRGAPKTHETKFGVHHPTRAGDYGAGTRGVERQAERLAAIDTVTAPPAALQALRRGKLKPLPLEGRMHGLTRAQHLDQFRRGTRAHVDSAIATRRAGAMFSRPAPVGASYDDEVRGLTRPNRKLAREGGFYTSERVRKSIATDKAFGAFASAARNPRYMLRAHPTGIATAGVGAAAAAAPHHSDRGRKLRDTAAGAVAGKVGYQLVGHGVKTSARRSVQWHARMSDMPTDTPAQQARKKQVKDEQKMRGAWQRSHGNRITGEAYRDFPLGVTTGDGRFVPHRRAKVFRTIGHTHGGRSGVLASTAVSTAAAVAGYRHASHTHGNRSEVGKSATYGYQDHRIRPVRAAEFTAGATLAAYGVPRLAMTGPLLVQGAKLVERYGGADAAAKALKAAEAARGALHEATRPLEQLKQIERVNHAVEIVPRHLRPAVATIAGALLMGRAHPVRQPVFVPLAGGNR